MSITIQETNNASGNWPSSGLERVSKCPVCSSEDRREEIDGLEDKIFGVAPGKWTLHRCLKCRSVYLDPRPDLSTIGLAYENYFTHTSAKTRTGATLVSWLRLMLGNSYRNRLFGTKLKPSMRGAWFLASVARGRAMDARLDGRGLDSLHDVKGNLLDVGCGNGAFLRFANQAGWTCSGVEPDAAAAAVAQSQGATILGSHLADLRGRFEAHFDVITLSHVIEHVHNPEECLKDCWSMLKPGGFLWIETPNIDSIGYEIYSRSWRGLEPPRHLVIFNPAALSGLLCEVGFVNIKVLPPWDHAERLFSLSASIAAGYVAEVEAAPLSKKARKEIDSNVRRAAIAVRKNPDRSEFIRTIAYKGLPVERL